MTQISNRPTTEHSSTIEELMIVRLGGRREYGKWLDNLRRVTRPKRSRRK